MKIKNLVKSLKLPMNSVLFLHVRIKGIDEELNYTEATRQLIQEINKQYKPQTILIPTFTYSFTKTGIYDRSLTMSETGRFGEEARHLYGSEYRTLNPVFSVIDTKKLFIENPKVNYRTAFQERSLFEELSRIGYVMVNINLDHLKPMHLHFMEWKYNVPYRYIKLFKGSILNNGREIAQVDYEYHVRKLDIDTAWRRMKLENLLQTKGALINISTDEFRLMWTHSFEMDKVLEPFFIEDINYVIKD